MHNAQELLQPVDIFLFALMQIRSPDWHITIQEAVRHYIQYTVPARPVVVRDTVDTAEGASVDLIYESHYRCWPPPLGMFIISIVEVGGSLQKVYKNI
jgi:hypothetical protein